MISVVHLLLYIELLGLRGRIFTMKNLLPTMHICLDFLVDLPGHTFSFAVTDGIS